MVRRAPRRRLTLRAWLAALLLALAGCAAGSPAGSGTLADHLNTALQSRSEAAFLDNFTPDASGSAQGRAWFTVLSEADATFTQLDPTTIEVAATLPGDQGPASWTLSLQLEGRSPFATGWIRGLEPTPERPIWTLGPVEVSAATHGTLLSSGLGEPARRLWTKRLDRAASVVAEAGLPGAAEWRGGLVVDLPADSADFQAITDELANTASALTSCETGTSRVVVNPLIIHETAEWQDSTMVHEAVHVATDSACVPPEQALAWAVEGLAESVAARTVPETAADNRLVVRDYLREHPVPDALPAELNDVTSYALAQVAVDQVRAQLGKKADDLLDRAIHNAPLVTPAELGQVTRWYRSELQRIRGTL